MFDRGADAFGEEYLTFPYTQWQCCVKGNIQKLKHQNELKMRILFNLLFTFFVYATKAEAVDDSLKGKREERLLTEQTETTADYSHQQFLSNPDTISSCKKKGARENVVTK